MPNDQPDALVRLPAPLVRKAALAHRPAALVPRPAPLVGEDQPGPFDAFEWTALYTDGTFLHEYGPNGECRGWKHIDTERLEALVLRPMSAHLHAVVLRLTNQMRPIFFRRRSILVNSTDDTEVSRATVTVVGMQTTVRSVNVKMFAYCFEDGSLLLSDDPNAI